MEYRNSILEQFGNTPLIKLNKINRGLKPQIFVLETSNGEKQDFSVSGYETIIKPIGTAKFHIFSAK